VGIEVQVFGEKKGEYICVYRDGARVEKYARTEKNSRRLAADLEVVFAKAAAVINQVCCLTCC
jgi:hypothetical protein